MGYLASAYLRLQALACLAWWAWLLLDPSAEALFWPEDTPKAVSRSFLLPDVFLFTGASIVTAHLIGASSAKAERWGWLTIGAIGYATLHCIALAFFDFEAWLAALSMGAALGGTILAVGATTRG